jgi:RNA-binding protein YhbY
LLNTDTVTNRAPQGCHPITWHEDLRTANIIAHNSKKNKLVRSVEQTIIHHPVIKLSMETTKREDDFFARK